MLSSFYFIMGSHSKQHMIEKILNCKWFLSLKLNKIKNMKKKLFKVRHIKRSRNCMTSNYTLGILGKLSMPRGAHIGFVTFHWKKNCHLQLIFATTNYCLQLHWQFIVAKIGYIYNIFSFGVWNCATQVIEYWNYFSMKIESIQNEIN